jgi:CheY-like chemotaxis protein
MRGRAPAPALRVLLCEDMPLVREVVCANLRRAGHEVTAVADGPAAWTAWREAVFDVAIVDWNLPGLRGAALVERLAQRGSVLVLTASSDLGIERQALAAGARQVLRKPISAPELAEALAAVAPGVVATGPSSGFAGEMAALQGAADQQLTAEADALLARWRTGAPLSSEAVHRFAGLAAQFGHAELAAAADAVEASLRGRTEGLDAAMSRFAAAAAQSAAEAPSSR